jgi:hypothetical protein
MKRVSLIFIFLAILSIQTSSIAKNFDATHVSWPDIAVDTAGNVHVVMIQYKLSGSMCEGYRIIHYRQLDENNWEKIIVYDKDIEPTSPFHPGKPSLCYGDGYLHLVYSERLDNGWRAVYKRYPVFVQPSFWEHIDTIQIIYDYEHSPDTTTPFQFDICYGATPSFIQSYPGSKCPHVALRFGPTGDKDLYYYYYYNDTGSLHFISKDVYISGLCDSFSIYVPLETYDGFSIYYISDDRQAVNMSTLAGIGPTGPFWTKEAIITEDDPFVVDSVCGMETPLDTTVKIAYYTTYNQYIRYLKYKYYYPSHPEWGWQSTQEYIDKGTIRYISNSSNFWDAEDGDSIFGVVYEKGAEPVHEIWYARSSENSVDLIHGRRLIDDSDNVIGQAPKSDRFGLDVVYLISGMYGCMTRYTKVDLEKKFHEAKPPEFKWDSVSETSVYVYPNPARENITIIIEPKDYPRVVSIYDLAGRLCSTVEVAPGTKILGVNVSNFTSGCYILTCNDPRAPRCSVPLIIAH